jgi:hypothetical protein
MTSRTRLTSYGLKAFQQISIARKTEEMHTQFQFPNLKEKDNNIKIDLRKQAYSQ